MPGRATGIPAFLTGTFADPIHALKGLLRAFATKSLAPVVAALVAFAIRLTNVVALPWVVAGWVGPSLVEFHALVFVLVPPAARQGRATASVRAQAQVHGGRTVRICGTIVERTPKAAPDFRYAVAFVRNGAA